MKRIALVPSEAIRERMAGIALRYLELARRLPAEGVEVVLLTPGEPEEVPEIPGEVRRFVRGSLATTLADCHGVVAQGQLANDVLLECPELPAAIDLYDPWLVENLHYLETLGLDPYRNDHATWVLQLSRGDFFLCSSEEQRMFYLGFLTALGRVNPVRVAEDPDLAGLIAAVPFGVPDSLEPHRPVLPPRREGERRLLFGGLYDWYDPETVLEALAEIEDRSWTLLVVQNPNAGSTPQRKMAEVEAECRRRGWWGSRVVTIEWVAAERRYDLLRDVDALVATHRPSVETRLSLRTRFLDALVAGCPAITSQGGTVARLLAEEEAGWVAPPGDPSALARILADVLDGTEVEERVARGRALAERFSWQQVLAPLVAFCRDPTSDPTQEDFAFKPSTTAPDDPVGFRISRKLSGLFSGGGG